MTLPASACSLDPRLENAVMTLLLRLAHATDNRYPRNFSGKEGLNIAGAFKLSRYCTEATDQK